MIFITDMIQVHSITIEFIPLQSGSVFYKRAKLTGAQYKHRYIIILDGNHRVIFKLDDHITFIIQSQCTSKRQNSSWVENDSKCRVNTSWLISIPLIASLLKNCSMLICHLYSFTPNSYFLTSLKATNTPSPSFFSLSLYNF